MLGTDKAAILVLCVRGRLIALNMTMHVHRFCFHRWFLGFGHDAVRSGELFTEERVVLVVLFAKVFHDYVVLARLKRCLERAVHMAFGYP